VDISAASGVCTTRHHTKNPRRQSPVGGGLSRRRAEPALQSRPGKQHIEPARHAVHGARTACGAGAAGASTHGHVDSQPCNQAPSRSRQGNTHCGREKAATSNHMKARIPRMDTLICRSSGMVMSCSSSSSIAPKSYSFVSARDTSTAGSIASTTTCARYGQPHQQPASACSQAAESACQA
jgi:hypothetical protein